MAAQRNGKWGMLAMERLPFTLWPMDGSFFFADHVGPSVLCCALCSGSDGETGLVRCSTMKHAAGLAPWIYRAQ